MLVGLTVAALLAAELPVLQTPLPTELPETAPSNAPARGSVPGPWAYAQLGGSLGDAILVDEKAHEVHLGMSVAAGFGTEIAGVKLAPVLSFSSRLRVVSSVRGPPALRPPAFTWSPLALTVASRDLVTEPRFTGLRLTPIVGVTMPTGPLSQVPITTVSVALQLERRFGPVELAYRVTAEGVFSRAATTAFAAPEWRLINRVLAEVWFVPSLSLAAGFATHTHWDRILVAMGRINKDEFVGGTAQLNWAFTELFGVTFDVATFKRLQDGPFPFWSFERENNSQFVLLAWFRTDALLMRNWLDR